MVDAAVVVPDHPAADMALVEPGQAAQIRRGFSCINRFTLEKKSITSRS